MNRHRSAIATCALLLAIGCLAIWEARTGSAAPAPPGVKRLCGDLSDAKPRVVLGRFSLFGEFEPNLRRSLDQIFAGNVEFGLLQQPDIAVFSLRRDSIDLQQFKNLPDLIEDAFNIGLTATQPTTQRLIAPIGAVDPRGQTLLAALKENNCEYLFGGRISREGIRINVEPYLLTIQSGEISRPFPSSSGDAQSLLKIADLFVGQLSAYLRERHHPAPRARFVEVACLTWAGALPSSFRSTAQKQ